MARATPPGRWQALFSGGPAVRLRRTPAGRGIIGTTLRPRERLRLTKRFLAIRRSGTLARGRMLSVWALPNNLTVTRLGLRVQRGLKGGVARNQAKRLVREAFRAHKAELKSGNDLLIVIHQIAGVSFRQLETELIKVCSTLQLVK